jgi:hypothetical protein
MRDPPLLTRLTAQCGDRELAIRLLRERGHIDGQGRLTALGMARQDMGPDGRARDRAARASGRPVTDYRYDPSTNRATLKRP